MLPLRLSLLVSSVLSALACSSSSDNEALRRPSAVVGDSGSASPAADGGAADAADGGGAGCIENAQAWRLATLHAELPASPGPAAFTPDGLVAAVLNRNNGDGIELFQRASTDKPFVRKQYITAGAIDGVRGLALSEDGTTLLGGGFGAKSATALKRESRDAFFSVQTDDTLTAAFNSAYPRDVFQVSDLGLLPDRSITAWTRYANDTGTVIERAVWVAADGTNRSAQLPAGFSRLLGATSVGPQVAWQRSGGDNLLANAPLDTASTPRSYVEGSNVVPLLPCLGAMGLASGADGGVYLAHFLPQASPAVSSSVQGAP